MKGICKWCGKATGYKDNEGNYWCGHCCERAKGVKEDVFRVD